MSNSKITNKTLTPKNRKLYSYIKKAVKNHFLDILDINSLREDMLYTTIKLKDSDKFLNIWYKFTENPKYGSVEAGYGQNLFKNYGKLKEAIRNGIFQLNNKFKMTGGEISFKSQIIEIGNRENKMDCPYNFVKNIITIFNEDLINKIFDMDHLTHYRLPRREPGEPTRTMIRYNTSDIRNLQRTRSYASLSEEAREILVSTIKNRKCIYTTATTTNIRKRLPIDLVLRGLKTLTKNNNAINNNSSNNSGYSEFYYDNIYGYDNTNRNIINNKKSFYTNSDHFNTYIMKQNGIFQYLLFCIEVFILKSNNGLRQNIFSQDDLSVLNDKITESGITIDHIKFLINCFEHPGQLGQDYVYKNYRNNNTKGAIIENTPIIKNSHIS